MSISTIRLKRSNTPNKIPTLSQLKLGEVALNTYDAELYAIRSRTGIGSEIVRLGAGATVTNIIYVTKDGKNTNTGLKLGDAKATIKGAVSVATTGSVIKVAAGNYIEDNPIYLPDQISIIGDSLREVSVSQSNTNTDLFYVGAGNYISQLSFVGGPSTCAMVAFDPFNRRYINQSTYVQNCTNFVQNSIGMQVDGNRVIGPLKSMVLDAYTQYNQGGIGVSITNEGYAQLVSLFTICPNQAVFCGSGAACDLTNSNASFGNYGLVADGLGPQKFVGFTTVATEEGKDTFTLDLRTPTLSITDASYNNTTGVLRVTTNRPHNLNIGMGVSIMGLQFSCPFEPGLRTYPSGKYGYIFKADTVAPGTYVDAYNLIQLNRSYIIDNAYNQIAVVYPSFVNPNPAKCKRDIGYIVDAISQDVRDYTNENIINATKSYFSYSGSLIQNGLVGELSESITAFNYARDLMKLAITNNLPSKNLSILADPATGSNISPTSCASVQSTIDTLTSILTTALTNQNLNSVPRKPTRSSTVFTVNVGIATQAHTYVSGGNVTVDVVRPFDGQVVYFDRLYYTVNKIIVGSAGTGYTETPEVTITDPSTDWGVAAQAVAVVDSTGGVSSYEIVSNGRGYTSIPTVTISSPNIGINTATATAELLPTYYSIISSTPISAGICTITINENLPYALGIGTEVPFYKQSRVLASGQAFEYIGSGTDIATAVPFSGGVPIQENEVDMRNGGLVVYTSTDQAGNFRIGEGVSVDQNTGTISGTFYAKSLFSTMTPFILALGGGD
jgi:hypothetical protein